LLIVKLDAASAVKLVNEAIFSVLNSSEWQAEHEPTVGTLSMEGPRARQPLPWQRLKVEAVTGEFQASATLM
jgi:hypothetical protein